MAAAAAPARLRPYSRIRSSSCRQRSPRCHSGQPRGMYRGRNSYNLSFCEAKRSSADVVLQRGNFISCETSRKGAPMYAFVLCLFGLSMISRSYRVKPTLLRRVQPSELSLFSTKSSSSSSSSAAAAPIAPSATSRRIEDIQSLLTDVTKVIVGTGFKNGFERTFQVSRAVSRLLREFVASPGTFRDKKTGLISPSFTLRRLFEELGATYIKLGQFVASSPTLFPAEYVLEFQSCLDKSPTVDFSVIRRTIQEGLGRPINSVFAYVDPKPLAAASIAQVHRARLLDGTEVVIKVRKPEVESTLRADLGFLFVSTRLLEFLNPALSRLSLSSIVGDLRESMLDELDFRKELRNLESFRSFLETSGIRDATAPFPYRFASSEKILTMDYLKGVPLVDLEGIRKYSANPEATLISALRTWAASVAENDVFHADVHGGNLLVLEDGRIGFIDFGIVGKISDKVWTAMNTLLQSLVLEDYEGVASSLIAMGATDKNIDKKSFGSQLEGVVRRIMSLQPEVAVRVDSDGSAVSAQVVVDERETTQLVLEIVGVAEGNGLKLPREFGLLLKQALYFDRYQKLLAPSLDPLRDSRVRDSFSQQQNKTPLIIDAEVVR